MKANFRAKVKRAARQVIIGNNFYLNLYLTYNSSGYNSSLSNFGFANPKSVFIIIIFSILMSLAIILIKKLQKLWIRILLYIFSYIVLVILLTIIQELIPAFEFDAYWISIIRFFGVLTLICTILYFAKDNIYSVIWSCLFGAGVSNLLNHFYPPFQVIDFLSSPLLSKYFGLGIFNLADLVPYLFIISMVLYSIIYFIREIKKRKITAPSKSQPYCVRVRRATNIAKSSNGYSGHSMCLKRR